ncbi:MAG TPA: PIG-L family deacetylase [archaeon]|nr:PIG-L family deacetylase [archaeon]
MPKALVIVAHPDDETIWMGGKIIREKNLEWTILSLCRKDDPDRKPKFLRVCTELGARGFISDLDDDHPQDPLKDLSEVSARIEPICADKEFDIVFTHGEKGEYGHNRHKEVHRSVLELIEGGMLKCKELFVFDYIRKENPFRCEPNPKATIKFELSDEEYERKKYLIHKVYGFEKGGFEYISCCPIENFRKVL